MTDAAFWDSIARKYAKSKISDVPAYEQTLDRVRQYLSREDRVLELGCGTGTTALKLANGVAEYIGTDVSPEMIAIAEEKRAAAPVDGLNLEVSDERASQFDNGTFDAVLGFNIFHLVPDPDAAFRRVHALLKPGGLFISKTPCLGKRWYLKPVIGAMQLVDKAPKTVHLIRVDDYDGIIAKAGFETVETGLYPPKVPSRFVVARKT